MPGSGISWPGAVGWEIVLQVLTKINNSEPLYKVWTAEMTGKRFSKAGYKSLP